MFEIDSEKLSYTWQEMLIKLNFKIDSEKHKCSQQPKLYLTRDAQELIVIPIRFNVRGNVLSWRFELVRLG